MAYPEIENFKKLAQRGNLIPVYREIVADMDTPVSAFSKLASSEYAFLLESIEGGEKWARYSFLGFDPSKVLIARGKEVEIVEGGGRQKLVCKNDPLEVLKSELDAYKPVSVSGLPRFSGGAVGYLAYDLVHYFENINDEGHDELDLPEALLIFTDNLLIFDNVSHVIKVVSNVFVPDGSDENAIGELYQAAIEKINDVISILRGSKTVTKSSVTSSESPSGYQLSGDFNGAVSNTTEEDFLNSVNRTIEYIRSGDAIQVVLSQRFSKKIGVSPFEVYRALRTINPSPYMFFLQFGDLFVAGSSPEVLVRLEEGEIEVRPIAGTRPRGKNKQEDLEFADDLLADPKEIAEHIMLVDLGRNDVGKVAKTSSVEVLDFMSIERYSHVMHIVSTVKGRVKEDCDMFDVFRSCFPAGTLSGAPKVRAMQIIEELEPSKRGLYGGAIGFFSFSGNMDMCITIRTVVIKDGVAHIQAGAGIVNDSVPESEYMETLNKARGMIKALEKAEKGM